MSKPGGSPEGGAGRSRRRRAARVLLLDGRDRLLLIHVQDASAEAPALWMTPGSGLHPGESFEQAALRELWEETGLAGVTLGPLVWRRRRRRQIAGRPFESLAHFFLVRLTEREVHVAPNELEPDEEAVLGEYRWWTAAELAAARDERFVPSRLAELLPPLIAGELPQTPIDVGP